MKKTLFVAASALFLSCIFGIGSLKAQQGPSRYADGDSLAKLVKMNYVYTFEDALRLSRQSHKPIFFNAFADFARPCHGMNSQVFSNEAFCKWMDEHFVCFFADVYKSENRYLAERYNIQTFAHYLVLDENGQVVHRIIGGSVLPDFQDKVAAALDPHTSLRGTSEVYQQGDRSKELLGAYLSALHDAGEDSLYKEILPLYRELLQEGDLVQKKNWFVVRNELNEGSQSEMFQFVVNHRNVMDANIGQETINEALSQIFVGELFQLIVDTTQTYNPSRLTDYYIAMQQAALPDSLTCYRLYDVAKAYGQKDYAKLLTLFPQINDIQLRTFVEISVKFNDISDADRANVIAYYREREQAYKAVRNSYGRAYQEIADQLESPTTQATGGIVFVTGTLDEALAQAKAEGKLVFVDCYTVWCGPCRALASRTFPQPEVGEYFNPRFVSIQIDMEKGEGVELAKKWGVDAYPTMIVLNTEGEVVGRFVGFLSPEALLNEAKKVAE